VERSVIREYSVPDGRSIVCTWLRGGEIVEIWESYGKGTKARREALKEKGLKQCTVCAGVKAEKEFGHDRGTCNLCRAAQEVKRNDASRPQADRIGQLWTDAEDTYIKDNHLNTTDAVMARHLRRTLKAVRRRRLFVLEINKDATPEPKVLLDTFERVSNDQIKVVTLSVEGTKVTVFCNTNTLWTNIWRAFKNEGLTDDDYKAWKVGVTN